MNQNRIAIVCDSGCDVPADFVASHDIYVVPLSINYGDKTYHSGIDITTQDVVNRFSQEIPTTSLPSPDMLSETFERCRQQGYASALFVGISSGLSSTVSTAHMIANMMEDFTVETLDTKNIGLGAGLLVMAATKLAEAGKTLSEIYTALEQRVEAARIFFSVPTLSYLHQGGRISEATYRLGSVLNIKPVFTCDAQGRYTVAKKCRGFERARETMLNLAAQRAQKLGRVVVGTCATTGDATFATLEAGMRERLGSSISEFVRATISPDLIVHTGPELIGITIQPAFE